MTPESPKTPPQLTETAVPEQPGGNVPETPIHETVSLLGLARASTPAGGRHFVAPSVDELAAALPQFAVEELIGAGGMGAVYRVRQKGLDRAAALKVLPRELADRPDFQERFLREAQALAKLNHPHLVTVYEVGQTNGWSWLLMEMVDGANLREVMSTGRLSPEQALKIVPQLCDALQYAHDNGVVHRDIKPENILIDTHGRLKLTDFGLAKMITKDGPLPGASLTQTGAMVGTMHYMAPEQFEGAKVDHRADIYAVGVVLYEMLTGSLPLGRFQPPSRQISVDVRIDDVVLKALDRDPEQRYQRASDVRIDVDRVRSDVKSVDARVGAIGDVASTDGTAEMKGAKAKIVKQSESSVGIGRESAADDSKGIGHRYGLGKILGITLVAFGVCALLVMKGTSTLTLIGMMVGLMLVASGAILFTRRARSVLEKSEDDEEKEIHRLLDRRYFHGIVMTLSGIVTIGMCVFAELCAKFYVLWQVRDKIGDVPYSADEITFALSRPPSLSATLGVLAGFLLVVGGWSWLTLRSRSLVVLGGITSLVIVPVFITLPLPSMYDDVLNISPFIAACLTLFILWITMRKSKLAPCFDPVRLATIGYARPSMGKSVGYGIGIVMGLVMAIGLGINESVKPLNREVIDLGKKTFALDMEPLELFEGDYVSNCVISVRSAFTLLDRMLREEQAFKGRLIDAGWSDQQHKQLDLVTAHLDQMRRGETPTTLSGLNSPGLWDGITRSRLVSELCSQAKTTVTQVRRAIEALETRADINAGDRRMLKMIEDDEDWISISTSFDYIRRDAALLGVVRAEEYKAQREVILGLTRQPWGNQSALEAARTALTTKWYSPTQADYLLLTARQVAPYATELHKWLAGVLASRTTTIALFSEHDDNVEQK